MIQPTDVNYAMAMAYESNSTMLESIKFIRKNFPAFAYTEDEKLEDIWDAIDAYVDLFNS